MRYDTLFREPLRDQDRIAHYKGKLLDRYHILFESVFFSLRSASTAAQSASESVTHELEKMEKNTSARQIYALRYP